jgi:mono/diheme cytochrome c family protein
MAIEIKEATGTDYAQLTYVSKGKGIFSFQCGYCHTPFRIKLSGERYVLHRCGGEKLRFRALELSQVVARAEATKAALEAVGKPEKSEGPFHIDGSMDLGELELIERIKQKLKTK